MITEKEQIWKYKIPPSSEWALSAAKTPWSSERLVAALICSRRRGFFRLQFKNITISNNVTYIEDEAFAGCANAKLTIVKGIKKIDSFSYRAGSI